MNMEIDTSAELSLEQKIKMHEAREGILERLAGDLPESIEIERFLNVIVSELGRMLDADRCDVLQLIDDKELQISHEWRRDKAIPSSKGTVIPIDKSRLSEQFDITRPIVINDTASSKDPTLKFFAKALETRSLLVIPISVKESVIGLLGLHDTKKPRVWLEEEVQFLESIARQMAIGYQYTRLYVQQEQESKRTNALLEIANTLNSHADFNEVSARVLERAINLVGADYGALGVIDHAEKRIALASFKSAEGVKPNRVLKIVESHGRSLNIDTFPAVAGLIRDGHTRQVSDAELPFAIRMIFNRSLGGKTALLSPVRVGGTTFGLIGFVWSKPTTFEEHDIALVEGIADQIGTALERDKLSTEVIRLKGELYQRSSEIVGQTPEIRRSIDLALSVADTPTTVLIQGESGTGKELLANLIHFNSGREGKTYIKINCGAIPEPLIESELFGHEKGAFTDARTQRRGRFEEADGGTLFLDEIAEMPLSAQVKLLRVLQDGELTRVGGNEVLKTDVRVIAASNVDLEEACNDGRFRSDLFFRLSVFPITVPPLRDRIDDILPLMVHFLDEFKEKTGRSVNGISPEAQQVLLSYAWPGNVRELQNTMERAVIIASGRTVEVDDLPPRILSNTNIVGNVRRVGIKQAFGDSTKIGFEIALPATLEEIEQRAIEATLHFTDGDKSQAARYLNIARKTLYRKLGQSDEGQ